MKGCTNPAKKRGVSLIPAALLLIAGILICGSAMAGWNGWVSTVNLHDGTHQAMLDYHMNSCVTSSYTAPQHLCVRDDGAQMIYYWYGETAPCPEGQELVNGRGCSSPPVSDSNGGPKCDAQSPNPVDIATGSKYQARIDYQSAAAFPIQFGFYFNSLNKVADNYFNSYWTHNYSRSLSISINAITGAWGSISDKWVLAKRDDGSAYVFVNNGNGTFRDRDGANSAYLQPLAGANNEYWKLSRPGDFEEYYDQNGRLLRIVDVETSMQQMLNYNGNQVTITHTNGESLTLVYAAPPVITEFDNFVSTRFSAPPVSVIAATGQFNYAYNDERTRLDSVTFISAEEGNTPIQIRKYLYEDSSHPLFYTKELDARDRVISSVTYHPDGRVASSQKGLTGEIHYFSYPTYAKTVVKNSFNLSTTYLFQVAPPRKVLNIAGAQLNNCLPTSDTIVYDSKNRRIGAINEKDNYLGTIYTYNDNNMITGIIEGGRINGTTPVYANADARYKGYEYYSNGQVKTVTQHYRNGPSSTASWVALAKNEYTYWPNNRIKSVTATDLSNYSTPLGNTSGVSRTTSYSYTYFSGAGLPADTIVETETIDGPLPGSQDVFTNTYDIKSNLVQSVNALGHAVHYRDHTSAGLPQTIEDSNGVITAITYHPLGWIKSVNVKDPSGNPNLNSEAAYTWYPNGTLEQLTLPDGSYLRYEYNDARNIIQIANNVGETINFTQNALGEWTNANTRDASNNMTRLQKRVFDELGRVKELIGNYGKRTTYNYDVKSNVSTINEVGSINLTTTNYYDSLSRVIRVLQPRRTEVNGQRTSINFNTYYKYNIQDRVTSVTDPKGNITSYVYNGFGNKITQTSPDTGVTQYWYDAQGNLTDTRDARGVHVQYHHDGLGRLTWIEYPTSGEDVHYYYDEVSSDNPYAIGRLTRITDASGSTQYRYDHRGNITHDIRTIGSTNYTTEYQYNLANNLVSMVYPSGRNVSYVRADALGRITAMTTRKDSNALEEQVLNSAAYLPFGPVTRFQYGNGLARQVPYDLDYRIDKITVSGSVTPMNLDYGYDAFNNITSILNGVDSQRSETFAYDDLQRLQHAYGAYGTGTNHIRYEYDPVGNRTLRALGQGSTMHTTETYSYDAVSNQLNSVSLAVGGSTSTRSLVHSDAGNLESESITAGPSKTYTYNDNNRLIELAEDNIVQGDYRHNALGQRVSKTTGTSTTHYLYGLQGELLAEANPEGQVLRQYLYLNGQLVGVIDVTN